MNKVRKVARLSWYDTVFEELNSVIRFSSTVQRTCKLWREYELFRFLTEPRVVQQSQKAKWLIHWFHWRFQRIYRENFEFSIKNRIFYSAPRIYSEHTHILSSCMRLVHKQCTEWGIGTYKRNFNEKYHLYQGVFATDSESFKSKFPAEVISSANVTACYDAEPRNHPLMAIIKELK